jgi:hypothetical protein
MTGQDSQVATRKKRKKKKDTPSVHFKIAEQKFRKRKKNIRITFVILASVFPESLNRWPGSENVVG